MENKPAFPVSTANLWNSLPAHLTSAPSLTVFRQRLRTSLFWGSYPNLIIWHRELTFGCGPTINYLGHIKNLIDDDDDELSE